MRGAAGAGPRLRARRAWAGRPRATSATATTDRRGVHRLQRPADATRTPAQVGPRPSTGAFLAGEIDRRAARLHRASSRAGAQKVVRRDADAARAATTIAGAPTPATSRPVAPSYEFEPAPERDPRPAAPALRRGARLRGAAQRGRVGARGPPAGDEGRDRQRRRAHHQPQPGHEPRPPGHDHHRDHGDRRRRRGAAPGRARRPTTSPTPSKAATRICSPRTRPTPDLPAATGAHHDDDRRHPRDHPQGRARRRDRRPGRRRRVPARRAARDQLRARDGRRARGRDDHRHRRGRAADRRRPGAGHLPEADRRPAARHGRAQHRSRHHRCRSATACSVTCST